MLLAVELTSRVQSLQSELAAMASARLAACEQVGHLTKQQLAEIKQMARNPPLVVRRLLVLLWLILHCDRCQDRAAVKINENKDWPRCQRMLADDGFVSRILNFDPDSLGAVPKVLEHVEANFATLRLGDRVNAKVAPGEQESYPERPSRPIPSRHARRILAWSSAPAEVLSREMPARRGLPFPASKSTDGDRACGLCLPLGVQEPTRTSTPRSPRSTPRSPRSPHSARATSGYLKEEILATPVSKSARGARTDTLPPVLTIPNVARASAPCGVLFRWMQELVVESRERAQIKEQLSAAGAELKAANEQKSSAEASAAALEAELSKARFALVAQEAARERAEEIRAEQMRREAQLNQQRHTLRNEKLEAGVKGCIDLEKEILIYQVRKCNKLSRWIQLPALR